MKIYSGDHLKEKIATGGIEALEVISDALLSRIGQGVAESPLAAPVYKKFLAKTLGIA
jgi:hypothetical protein